MILCSKSRVFIWFCVYLTAIVAEEIQLSVVHEEQYGRNCSEKCKGPLRYYRNLGCKPHYVGKSCCAVKYDCRVLKKINDNQCYYKGYLYEIGDKLAEKDLLPCERSCVCGILEDGSTGFNCEKKVCHTDSTKPGCYRRKVPDLCCPGEQVCPEKPEDRVTCNVTGTIFKDGERFLYSKTGDLLCTCQPGYEGENIAPFCKQFNRLVRCAETDLNMFKKHIISNNCAPIYTESDSGSLQSACAQAFRCQFPFDAVARPLIDDSRRWWSKNEHRIRNMLLGRDPDNTDNYPLTILELDHCKLGNVTMFIGEELVHNTNTLSNTSCIKCVCEVPPVPTCIHLSNCGTAPSKPSNKTKCDQTQCPGPLAFYNALSCKPKYKYNGACCAYKYNCHHLQVKDKCFLYDREYKNDDKLISKDQITCQESCTCRNGTHGFASFKCNKPKCCKQPDNATLSYPLCYNNTSPRHCCPGQRVCLDKREISSCEVDGVTYSLGDVFTPMDNPYLRCTCQPGYSGNNVPPFCKEFERPYCLNALYYRDDLLKNCAPVYSNNETNLSAACNMRTYCRKRTDGITYLPIPDDVCIFSDITILLDVNGHSACIKCVCEVPPIPTCKLTWCDTGSGCVCGIKWAPKTYLSGPVYDKYHGI